MSLVELATGVVACTALAVGFVGVCYLLPASVANLPPSDPQFIKWRVGNAAVYSVVVTSIVYGALAAMSDADSAWRWLPPFSLLPTASASAAQSSLPLMGFDKSAPSTIDALLRVLLLFVIFYAGPLLRAVLVTADATDCLLSRWQAEVQAGRPVPPPPAPGSLALRLSSRARRCLLAAAANNCDPISLAPAESFKAVVAAPITEELVFRACMLALLTFFGWSSTAAVWLAPLFFGLAHVHHSFHGAPAAMSKADFLRRVKRAAFRTGYTSIFGVLSGAVLVRSGSIVAPMLLHALCNLVGLPAFDWRDKPVERHSPPAAASVGVGGGADDEATAGTRAGDDADTLGDGGYVAAAGGQPGDQPAEVPGVRRRGARPPTVGSDEGADPLGVSPPGALGLLVEVPVACVTPPRPGGANNVWTRAQSATDTVHCKRYCKWRWVVASMYLAGLVAMPFLPNLLF